MINTHEEDDWEGYRCLSFRSQEVKVVVSLLHPWAVRDQITHSDMREQDFLKMRVDSNNYNVPREQAFYENVPCRGVREVSNFDTLYALVQQGEGFALFPQEFVYMNQAKIKCFDFPGRRFVFHTAMIYRENNLLEGFSEVIARLKEEFDLKEI